MDRKPVRNHEIHKSNTEVNSEAEDIQQEVTDKNQEKLDENQEFFDTVIKILEEAEEILNTDYCDSKTHREDLLKKHEDIEKSQENIALALQEIEDFTGVEEEQREEMINELKSNYILLQAKKEELSFENFRNERHYDQSEIDSDARYVSRLESKFATRPKSEVERKAKIAEALITTAMRQSEFFMDEETEQGKKKTIEAMPITRYDDIANGADAGAVIIQEGETFAQPFVFDVTMKHSREGLVEKIFRPSKKTGEIGCTPLKYAEINRSDGSIFRGAITSVPRFTIALDEKEINQMISDIEIEELDPDDESDDSERAVYTNISSNAKQHYRIYMQLCEQATFYRNVLSDSLEQMEEKFAKQDPESSSEIITADDIEKHKKLIEAYKNLEQTFQTGLSSVRKVLRKELGKKLGENSSLDFNNDKERKLNTQINIAINESKGTSDLIKNLRDFGGYNQDVFDDTYNREFRSQVILRHKQVEDTPNAGLASIRRNQAGNKAMQIAYKRAIRKSCSETKRRKRCADGYEEYANAQTKKLKSF